MRKIKKIQKIDFHKFFYSLILNVIYKNLFELANSWIGVKFRWHGYTKLGCDCIGLVVGILQENNIINNNFLQKFKQYKYGNNLSNIKIKNVLNDLKEYFTEVDEIEQADLLIVSYKNSPIHFIIFEKGKTRENAKIIHVNNQINKVYTTNFDKSLKIIKLLQLKLIE